MCSATKSMALSPTIVRHTEVRDIVRALAAWQAHLELSPNSFGRQEWDAPRLGRPRGRRLPPSTRGVRLAV
jgi:hypothetical protein